jgi:hypothetical protein
MAHSIRRESGGGYPLGGCKERPVQPNRPQRGTAKIAQLAYFLYESRGRRDGDDIEDWLRAEQELLGH